MNCGKLSHARTSASGVVAAETSLVATPASTSPRPISPATLSRLAWLATMAPLRIAAFPATSVAVLNTALWPSIWSITRPPRVVALLRVAVLDLGAAETRPRVVQLPVHPINYASIKVGHRPLVRLADESLALFLREIAARLSRLGVFSINALNRQQCVIQKPFGHVKYALPHGRQRGAILPEQLVSPRPACNRVWPLHHDVAREP